MRAAMPGLATTGHNPHDIPLSSRTRVTVFGLPISRSCSSPAPPRYVAIHAGGGGRVHDPPAPNPNLAAHNGAAHPGEPQRLAGNPAGGLRRRRARMGGAPAGAATVGRLGAIGALGEPVLRQQSRRPVASGPEARSVASGRATDLAGRPRPSRNLPRASRGRGRRAPGARERLCHPPRSCRRVIGAVLPEL